LPPIDLGADAPIEWAHLLADGAVVDGVYPCAAAAQALHTRRVAQDAGAAARADNFATGTHQRSAPAESKDAGGHAAVTQLAGPAFHSAGVLAQ